MSKKSLVLGVCALMLLLVVFSSGCLDTEERERKGTIMECYCCPKQF